MEIIIFLLGFGGERGGEKCVIVNLRPPDLSQQFLYKIGSDSRMINYERLFDKITDNYVGSIELVG